MAHEVETAPFARQPAWHRLGTVVQDTPTVEDAILLAGLDWRVEERMIAYFTPELVAKEIKTHKAIVRVTDGRCLGVVGANYQPLQNEQAFQFFNPVLSAGHAALEAAGSLRGGRRVWILTRLKNRSAEVIPGDQVDAYLLLANSHDGSGALRVQFTAIRVLCSNTLSVAERRGDQGIEQCLRARHTQGLQMSLKAISRALDLTNRTFSVTVEAYQALAGKGMSVTGLREYVKEVLGLDEEELRNGRTIQAIEERHETGPGMDLPGVRGTFWGALNAVTDWVGHVRGKDQERRLDSLWFGKGRAIRERALKVALEALN